jgi:predicted ester cyclase
MSTTDLAHNKATFRRFHDAINSGDPEFVCETIDAIVDPDVQIRTPLPIDETGARALKEVTVMLLRAFPDLHVTIEDLIAEGDKVVGRNALTGTQRGEYMGLAPTGRAIAYDEIFIFRFVDGRIAETWGVVDVFSQMRQLGANAGAAAPAPASSRRRFSHPESQAQCQPPRIVTVAVERMSVTCEPVRPESFTVKLWVGSPVACAQIGIAIVFDAMLPEKVIVPVILPP